MAAPAGSGEAALWKRVLVMLDALWRRSTRSQDTNCVEVAHVDGQVLIRDSKDRESVMLAVSACDWTEFVAAVKDGEFDHS
jgi:hypothetical protein